MAEPATVNFDGEEYEPAAPAAPQAQAPATVKFDGEDYEAPKEDGWGGYLSTAGRELGKGLLEGVGQVASGIPEPTHVVNPNIDKNDPWRGSGDSGTAGLIWPMQEGQPGAFQRTGKAIKGFAERNIPTTETEDKSITGSVARSVGQMGAPLASAALNPALPLVLMGLQGKGEQEEAAREHGASEEDIQAAGNWGFLLNAAGGIIPVHAILKPIERSAPGLADWAVTRLKKAATDGMVFATMGEAQAWLGDEIAKAYYDPNAGYSFDFRRALGSYITGGLLGQLHPAKYKPPEAEAPPVPGTGEESTGAPTPPPPPDAGQAASPAQPAPPAGPRRPGAEQIASVLGPPVPENESILPEQQERAPEWKPELDTTPGVKAFGQEQADALKRTWAQTSPIQTIDHLFEGAEENQKQLGDLGQSIADEVDGAEWHNPGVKKRARTQEKIDDGKSPSRINDVVRGGFVIERPGQAEEVVQRIAAKYPIIDEGWAVTPEGYFDRKVLVRFPNGQAGEIQLWHPALYKAKDQHGTKLYTEARTLPEGDPRKAELFLQQQEIYERALEAADPEWRGVISGSSNAGNLARNASSDMARASIPTTEELAGRQEPSMNTRATEGVNTTGSPSQEPNINFSAAINQNIGADGTVGNAVPAIRPHKVTAADGTRIDVAPIVVEADTLRTSQDAGYDPDLQPRQRDRAASQGQVRDIASRLDPERLGYSSEADRGAPIVGPDGMVESGNGRVLALRNVYSSKPENAKAYRNWLSRQGVDVSQYRNPVLVRLRTTPLTPEGRKHFTVAANQAATLAMSAPERALADAGHVTSDMLSLIQNPDDLGAAGNRQFMRRFVAALPQAEQGAMADAQGHLSAEGLARVRNAILAKAYGDAGTLARIAESTNDEVKSISNAMVAAAPQWAKFRAEIDAGRVRPDMDATPQLLEAVSRTADLRSKGVKLDEHLAQLDAFSRPEPSVEDFMRAFFNPKTRRAMGADRITDELRFFAQEASKVTRETGLDLGMAPVSADQIARVMREKGEKDALSDRNGAGAGPGDETGGGKTRGPGSGKAGEGTGEAGPFRHDEAVVRASRGFEPYSDRQLGLESVEPENEEQRAKREGFDTSKEYWHGTTHGEFSEFRESTQENDVLGPAIYLGDTKGKADFYGPGRGGDLLGPFWVRGKVVRENDPVRWDDKSDKTAPAINVMGKLKMQLADSRMREPWGADLTPAQYAREFWKRRGVDGYNSGFEVAVYDPVNVRAGFRPEKKTETVTLAGGKKGEQGVLPGASKISNAELARSRAASPLRPQAPQEAPGGMFGETRHQEELFEPRKPTPAPERSQPEGVADVAPDDKGTRIGRFTLEGEPIGEDGYTGGRFPIKDASGKEIGHVDASYNPESKSLYVDVDAVAKNQLGSAATRDLLRQLQSKFPEATSIAGERITGARAASTKINLPLTPRAAVPNSATDLFGEPTNGGRDNRPAGAEVRGRAPQVPGKQQPRVPTPAKRPDQLSLFGGEPSGGEVGRHDVQVPPQPRGSEAPGTGPSESVTKPPAVGGGSDSGRTDPRTTPARAGLKEAEQKIAERSRSNYRITDDDLIGDGGPKTKVRQNIEAIRLLKQIEDEGREATPEEKAVLVKYVGWGAFSQVIFDPYKPRPEWKAERDALRALMTDEEWNDARHSTVNAHYTSPEVIRGMWDTLSHLGYEGGSAIEPAAGIGHFIGLIPDSVAPRTAWTAVELDSVSARLTKALYGGAEVNAHGYQDLKRPSNYYDLAISNVPFSEVPVREKPYGAFPLHDFFFVKSLDKVRPGGMVAFITSRYTMDKDNSGTRKRLAKDADLVGAIRLPGGNKGAFASNAGTEVTTDILFLRKKIPGEKPFPGAAWTETKVHDTPEGPMKLNEYFADNPHMMLGDMRLTGTMYGKNEPVLIGDTEGLQQKIADAAKKMQAGALAPRIEAPTLENLHAIDTQGVKDGGFFLKGGKMFRRVAGEGVPQNLSEANHDRVSRLMGLRDLYDKILDAQLKGEDSEPFREKMRDAYKKFVDKYGPINKEDHTVTSRLNSKGEHVVITKQPNFSAFRSDPDAWKVASIENYDAEKGTAKPADIQTKDVLHAPAVREINGPGDALAAALNDTGRVDLDHIANSLGVADLDQAAGALGDLVYHDPNGRQWRTADEYLSGNVVQKLEEARAIAQNEPLYLRNVAALEKVQPELIPPGVDITTQFGAPWVPAEVYKDFITEVLGGDRVKIAMSPDTGQWHVEAGHFASDARAKFGITKRGGTLDDTLDAALNNKKVTIYGERDDDGKRPVDAKATEEANNKVALLREAFSGDPEYGIDGWVWQDPDRSQQLAAIYNRTYNNLANRQFDGSHLTFPGLNPKFSDRQHRKDAVWRIIQSGNTLLAHEVGSGKTVTMIAAGMEQKRLGLIQKPAFVIPNHMLEQFSREFIEAYPDARILVASKDEMSADSRRAFIAKTAANNWDGIIITHDAFGRIGVSDEFRRQHIQEQIDQYIGMINDEVAATDKKSPTVKALEKKKDALEEKLKGLMNVERKDEGLNFEHTGIDQLFVDEAHLFKNLSFPTRMQRVKGLGQGDAQRAEDLFLKIRYLEQNKPGRSAIFATGTPVSNTMAELWTMQRYLQLDKLRERGLDNFDKWANTFGKIQNTVELGPDGRTLHDVTSFSKFVNLPELVSLYSEIADTKTAEQLNLPRPDVKTRSGAPGIEIEQSQPSEAEEKAIQDLVKEAESMKGKRPEKGQRIMLNVVTDGRKVATDGRLLGPDFDFNPQGKVAKAIGNIHRIYEEGNKDPDAPNKVQMVFLDMGVPGEAAEGKHRFNLYKDIKDRLVDKGIPANEIASIHDADNDIKKARLFQAVRDGKIRVLLGSTGKMGVGTNVQDRLIAMHHIDAPWKPAEVTQRDGRIIRQGNKNKNVQIYRYVTKHSFDAFMWQTLDRKARFIGQVLSGTKGSRTAEDVDSPLPEAEEMKAAASGDPRIIEHAELNRTVRALSSQRRTFESTQARASQEIGGAKSRIEQYENALPDAREDAQRVTDTTGDKFSVDLGDKGVFNERKAAGQAVLDGIKNLDPRAYYRPTVVKIGTLSGFDMNMEIRSGWSGGAEGSVIRATPSLKGKAGYGAVNDLVLNEHTDPVQLMTRFEKILRNVKDNPDRLDGLLKGERETVRRLEKTQGEVWPKEKEYKNAIAKLSELSDALKAPKHPDVAEQEVKARRGENRQNVEEPEGERVHIGGDTYAYLNPKFTVAEKHLADAVQTIADRLAPQANVEVARAITSSGTPIHGLFHNTKQFPQFIAWALERPGRPEVTPAGAARTVRHEIIHHIKEAGLIRPDEWRVLADAAERDGWLEKYKIEQQYPELDRQGQIEEAVADRFGDWRREPGVEKQGLIRSAFNRLDLLLKRVGAAARQFLGKDATPADVFTRIETGEVGKRRSDMIERQKQYFARNEEPHFERPAVTEEEARKRVRPKLSPTQRIAQNKTIKAFGDAWKTTFQPELVSDKAFDADPLFAAYKAGRGNARDLVTHYLKADWNYWNKRSQKEGVDWMDDMEHKRAPADPEQAHMARTYESLLERNYHNEKQLGSKAGYVDGYFPHIWEQPERAESWVKSQIGQLGPRWFQKERTIDFIKEGLEMGLKLRFSNPIDMLQHRFLSGVDMRLRMELLQNLRRSGLAWETRQRIDSERRPEAPVEEGLPAAAGNDPNLFGFKPKDPHNPAKQLPLLDSVAGDTLEKKGWQRINAPDGRQWMIAPDIQPLWKNAVQAQSLWQSAGAGGKVFRGWMAMKNRWVPIKLAISMFHPMHVLHINMSQHLAAAAYKVRHGQNFAGALGELARAPIGGFYQDVKRGASAKQAWYTPPDKRTPEQAAVVKTMVEGGMRPGIPEEMKIHAMRSFKEALGKIQRKEAGAGDYWSLVHNSLGIGLEKMQGAIFEKWIPALKVSAYMDQAAALMNAHPELMHNETQRRDALRTIAKSIDNRYGEMNYDVLFWNRMVKDGGIASFLSLGWNLGFVREFGGAPLETAMRAKDLVTGKQLTPGKQAARQASNKMAFALSYVSSAALISGAMTYLMGGQMPTGLDWIFPRIGGENPDGSPRRVTTMFYTREVPMLLKHIQDQGGGVGGILSGSGEMLWNKLMFEPFTELLHNRNYFGYDIWDSQAPIYKQIWQGAQHWIGDQGPMAVSGATHAAQLSGKEWPSWKESIQHPDKLIDALTAKGVGLSFLGFGPAPAYVEKSALQNRIAHLYGEYVAAAHKPMEEGANLTEKMAVRQAVMQAKRTHDAEGLKKAMERGKVLGMTPKSLANIGKMPGDIYMFSRLPAELQEDILHNATPEEQKKYWPHANKKVRAKISKEDRESDKEDEDEDEAPKRADGGTIELDPPPGPFSAQNYKYDDTPTPEQLDRSAEGKATANKLKNYEMMMDSAQSWKPSPPSHAMRASGGRVERPLPAGYTAEYAFPGERWGIYDASGALHATGKTRDEAIDALTPKRADGGSVDEDLDYDMQGALAAGVQPDDRGHFPDTYKLPSHITFSDESKYHNDENQGGHWDHVQGDEWNFTPGPANFKHHSAEEMQDYFKRNEPASHLILPEKRAHGGRVDRRNIDHAPTEAQKSAGNYRKDVVHIHGLRIVIENAKGSVRHGVGKDGRPWFSILPAHYGDIKRTEGADGDAVDVFLGPHVKSPHAFIIDQIDPDTGKYDESKVMLGFGSRTQAVNIYKKAFADDKGADRIGGVSSVSIDSLRSWLENGDTKKPFEGRHEKSDHPGEARAL